ncbi:hypothetical protein SAMN04488540_11645 [Ferrimonas sediminum]|uniref:WD40-like Beta Propeller Repeat n=1 Tax=Ferrimonas sediminum TaxID=718193 RepID=A0A1G8XYS6_9GAMM|nr:hypothetical protein [Ferrimonas sediminum]SDJ95667.1 hypothetical protein SAMN04488540_11645 [Ferrimonas sediminum]
MSLKPILSLLILALLALPALAEHPSDDWRTLETDLYRIHFTPEYELWARQLAVEADTIQRHVGNQIGHQLGEKVDIVIRDPLNVANGFALPLVGRSRTVFYTTAPLSDSVLSYLDDWRTLLLVHEQAHLNHLSRPSRSSLTQLWQALYIGFLEVPRWAAEGYATVIEHQHNGKGRPANHLVNAILRQWAREGALPNYQQLSGDDDAYLGMSMAYLMGSSYLLWLQSEYGTDSLPAVWTRMAAKQGRDFEQAFKGVFGQTPQRLYRRFVAETTYQALAAEARMSDPQASLWLEHRWGLSRPALSADGSKLALLLKDKNSDRQRLVIYPTADNPKARQQWQQRQQARLKKDPEDIADIEPRVFNPEPLHQLPTRSWRMTAPRWLDPDTLIFSQAQQDDGGNWHFDLFTWQPGGNGVRRLTRNQNLVRVAPHEDGKRALALQRQYGHNRIVEIDLASGTLTPVVEAQGNDLLDFPAYRPDSQQISFLRHRHGHWQLILDSEGDQQQLGLNQVNQGNFISYPQWLDARSLLLTLGQADGIANYRLDLQHNRLERLTSHKLLATAATADDQRLYFVATDSQGQSLYRQPLSHQVGSAITLAAPTQVADTTPLPHLNREALPYGTGPHYLALAFGANLSPWQQGLEVGLKGGDPVNRLRWQLMAHWDPSGHQQGLLTSLRWQGWPIQVHGDLYYLQQDLQGLDGSNAPELDERRSGAHLGLAWQRRWSDWLSLQLSTGATLSQIDDRALSRNGIDQRSAYADVTANGHWQRGRWNAHYHLGGRASSGETDQQQWHRYDSTVSAALGFGDWRLSGGYQRLNLLGNPSDYDRLRLGGSDTSLTPSWLPWGQHTNAALPLSALVGQELQQWQAGVSYQAVRTFYQRYQMDKGSSLPVYGIEFQLQGLGPELDDALPELDGLNLRLGAGWAGDNGVDDPLGWSGWINLFYQL